MTPALEERVAKLEDEVKRLEARTRSGQPERHPLADVIGIGANDPLIDEWRAAVAERRREMDADPNVP